MNMDLMQGVGVVSFPLYVLERMWMRRRLGKEKEKMYRKFLKYSCR